MVDRLLLAKALGDEQMAAENSGSISSICGELSRVHP